jgi:drug/metabolite transporter (DMT)-like permease
MKNAAQARYLAIAESLFVTLILFLIGLSFEVIGNGAQYLGPDYIPATTASLLLGFVPVLVLAASTLWLHEAPTRFHRNHLWPRRECPVFPA